MPRERKRSKTEQLAALARATGAKREPYYIRRPIPPGLEETFRVEGWYWIPAGGDEVEFLAGNFPEAYYALRRIVERSLQPG